MFEEFMTDTIFIQKQSGEKTGVNKASIQKKGVFLDRSDILVEVGDLIERHMSNGGIETF